MKALYFLCFLLTFCSSSSEAFAVPALGPGPPPGKLRAVLYPNYLVPIKQEFPYEPFDTQKTATIHFETLPHWREELRMLVGFDVPPTYGGDKCYIRFTLPKKKPGQGGYEWTVNGSGKLDVWYLDGIIQLGETSWKNKPARLAYSPHFKIVQPLAGGDATIYGAGIPCRGGDRMDFEVAGNRQKPVFFDWFELNSPKTGITLEMRY